MNSFYSNPSQRSEVLALEKGKAWVQTNSSHNTVHLSHFKFHSQFLFSFFHCLLQILSLKWTFLIFSFRNLNVLIQSSAHAFIETLLCSQLLHGDPHAAVERSLEDDGRHVHGSELLHRGAVGRRRQRGPGDRGAARRQRWDAGMYETMVMVVVVRRMVMVVMVMVKVMMSVCLSVCLSLALSLSLSLSIYKNMSF